MAPGSLPGLTPIPSSFGSDAVSSWSGEEEGERGVSGRPSFMGLLGSNWIPTNSCSANGVTSKDCKQVKRIYLLHVITGLNCVYLLTQLHVQLSYKECTLWFIANSFMYYYIHTYMYM